MPFLFLFRLVFVEFFSISSHVLIHTFKFRVRSPLVIRRATHFHSIAWNLCLWLCLPHTRARWLGGEQQFWFFGILTRNFYISFRSPILFIIFFLFRPSTHTATVVRSAVFLSRARTTHVRIPQPLHHCLGKSFSHTAKSEINEKTTRRTSFRLKIVVGISVRDY